METHQHCPECGNSGEGFETYTEEIPYGSPTNLSSRGAEAPRYKTKTARVWHCERCGWSNKY